MKRPKRVPTYVNLPEDVRFAIETIASEEQLDMSDIIRRAVAEYVQKHPPKAKARPKTAARDRAEGR